MPFFNINFSFGNITFSNIILIILFINIWYSFYTLGRIWNNSKKDIALLGILSLIALIILSINKAPIFYIVGGIVILLYQFYYDEEPFRIQGIWSIPYLILNIILVHIFPTNLLIFLIPTVSFLLISYKKGLLYLNYVVPPIVVSLILYILNEKNTEINNGIIEILISMTITILYFYIDGTLSKTISKLEISSENFKKKVLASQYNEIKEIYLQMRGWRHDYHSHLQSMKAYIRRDEILKLSSYLNELEEELDSINLVVNTENKMLDAILNSKLTLAKNHNIKFDVKVELKEELKINDTDLCIILGNLLDNAIEANDELSEELRFIRIYISTFNKQLYLSIQNSAKEILSFNEKNYISTKRGNHGLGMKRVALIVESYNGFLNLQNEPGIFASEVTLPLINNRR